MGEGIHDLRWLLMLLCLAVFAVGFGGMFVSMWKRHRSAVAEAPNFHGSVAVEICWAVAPCVIVVLMVLPTVKVILGT